MTGKAAAYPESDYLTVIEPATLPDGRVLWGAQHPELLGCTAQGESPEEAIRNLASAFRTYVEHFAEFHLHLPLPRRHRISKVIWSDAKASYAFTSTGAASFRLEARPDPQASRVSTGAA